MLTQEPAPDPKYKLNISLSFTFSHPLDCLICAKDIMIVVLLLLQMMGDEKVDRWFIYVRVWVRGQGLGVIFFLLILCFCAVVNFSFMTGAWQFCVSFFLFLFFVSNPFNHVCRNCSVCFEKLFQKLGF